MKNVSISKNMNLEKDVKKLLNQADVLITNTVANINHELINLYWNIGKIIFEYKRDNNSKYGDAVVSQFNKELNLRHGKRFDRRNIFRMIKFYEVFSKVAPGPQSNNELFPILNPNSKSYQKIPPGGLFKNISWSHIRELLILKDINTIQFYLNEIENKKLTKEQLISIIKSKSYERTILNQRKGIIKNEIEKSLRDPIILNIKNKKRSEKELENEIVKNISNFKKEIGNIVTFYERQYKININGLMHKVDLVFLDYETNTFILVDLKINKVTNHDIMQMKLYIEYFSKEIKHKKANIIGLILCETKDVRVETRNDIYQIKYLNEIPKEKELLKIINENKVILLKTDNLKIGEI